MDIKLRVLQSRLIEKMHLDKNYKKQYRLIEVTELSEEKSREQR